MRLFGALIILFSASVHADEQIFADTCEMLKEIVGKESCDDVEIPAIEEIPNWPHMGNYFYDQNKVVLREGLTSNTRDRVLAHELAHHILHITGIALVNKGIEELCTSEVLSHEVSKLYAQKYKHIMAPGEINWIDLRPECQGKVDSNAK